MDWAVKKYPMYLGGVKQPYAKTVVVGNLVFANADGRDSKTGKVTSNQLEAQWTVVLDNLRSAMEEAGSSMNNIVKTWIFVKNGVDYTEVRKIEQEYYKKYAPALFEEPPASTFTPERSLESPEFLVAVEAIGVKSMNEPGWEVKKYPLVYGGVKQPYSRSAVVGNLVFLSSASARDAKTGKIDPQILQNMDAQMSAVHDNIGIALKEAGSSPNNIVKTFHFLKELLPRVMWKAELEYYQKHARVLIEQDAPASTFMQLPSLSSPEHQAEAEIIGVVSRNRPGWELKVTPLYYAENRRYFCKCVAVGKLIIGSGNAGGTIQTGEVESDILEEHLANSFARTKLALEETGSSMNDIFKSMYLVKQQDFIPRILKAEEECYRKHAPRLVAEPQAKLFVQPQSLANPKYLVEIENWAVVSK